LPQKIFDDYITIDFRQVLEVVAGCKGISDMEGLR
jgi:hypothetical protein